MRFGVCRNAVTPQVLTEALSSLSTYTASEDVHSRTATSRRDQKLESTPQFPVPFENTKGYQILYTIENALRMLIVDQLETVAGSRWYKQRLPADILAAYQTARDEERKIKWIDLVPHHPIYYVDFPSLKKIVEQKNNWNDAFKVIFRRKDIFAASWSAVEPIRNKVAHNRQIGQTELVSLKHTFNFLTHSVGTDEFTALARQSISIPDIILRITALRNEGESTIQKCRCFERIESLDTWNSISNSWWFDDSYIGSELSPIQIYFDTIKEYTLLPRRRGQGHLIEKWIREAKVNQLFARSDNLLAKLMKE